MSSGVYKIRPAGRHLLTIGRDLIQDNYAAIIELVKNAYDADSPDVEISFQARNDLKGYIIEIKDHGHGMPLDTIINKWLVPSTGDKLNRKISPRGRIMQGRKGIGRYAASRSSSMASMLRTQWSSPLSCVAKSPSRVKTWSLKPPMLRMSVRFFAGVVTYGWMSMQTSLACGQRCFRVSHSASRALLWPCT